MPLLLLNTKLFAPLPPLLMPSFMSASAAVCASSHLKASWLNLCVCWLVCVCVKGKGGKGNVGAAVIAAVCLCAQISNLASLYIFTSKGARQSGVLILLLLFLLLLHAYPCPWQAWAAMLTASLYTVGHPHIHCTVTDLYTSRHDMSGLLRSGGVLKRWMHS